MVVGPFSETFGRNPVYIGSMFCFMIFNMAAALSPDIAAQIVFRFFVGVFAAPPLVCGGGTISDLFSPLERTWAFPLYAIIGFVSCASFRVGCPSNNPQGRTYARSGSMFLRLRLALAMG